MAGWQVWEEVVSAVVDAGYRGVMESERTQAQEDSAQADDRQPRVSGATRQADRRDAEVTGHADRPPTAEEEALAEDQELDAAAARSYKEAIERGADQKGEGRIA
ncbi:MAG: hypothetical protein ACYDAD_11940 [Acidimicrobiales bacterium]